MAEDRVGAQLQGAGQRADVCRHLAEGPGRGVARCRATLCALVDQDQPVAVAERVEVVGELVVVEPGPAVEQQQRVALAPLDDVQLRVTDVDQAAGAGECAHGT